MNTEPGLHELEAFVDGELELSRHFEIERRLADSGALRAQVESVRDLRQSVRGQADYHAAPASLRAALAASVAAARPEEPGVTDTLPDAGRKSSPAAPVERLRDAAQRWGVGRPLASALALALVATVGVNVVMSQRWQDDRLRDEVVASHARATLTEHLVDVESSDHHTVKPFLSSRLDFSPPVRELAVPGSVLLGGRVDYLDGRPVAAIVYRQGKHLVDAFVWPTKESDSRVRMSSERGFHLARWSRDGMAHCVISDVSPDMFAAIAKDLAAPVSTGSD